MAASNTRETRKELQQRFAERRSGSGTPMGYEDEAGTPLDVVGDAEAPFFKTPPFTEDPQLWQEPVLVPNAAYLTLPEIDTKQYRLRALYITYTIPAVGGPPPPEGVGQLSIVPEVRSLDAVTWQLQWYTLAMVDLAPTYTTLAAPFAPLVAGFASRDFAPSEFRWPPAPIGPVAVETTLRTRLLFDVSDTEAIRFSVNEINADSDLQNTFAAMYARSQ